MATKVIVVADIHIKIENTTDYYNDWNYKRLMELASVIKKYEHSELWVLGDLFDKASPSLFDIMAAAEFVRATGKCVKVLEGNHERINKEQYTLHLLKGIIGVTILPDTFTIDGTKITAVGHDKLDTLSKCEGSNLLLSHVRWHHPVFGAGELPRKLEKEVRSKFDTVLLGDIHYPYEPETNVSYVSSPYSISYSSRSDYSLVILELDNGNALIHRRSLDLPCKIVLQTSFSNLKATLRGLGNRHLYRINVEASIDDMETLGKMHTPLNIEIIGVYKDADSKLEVINVTGDIKDMLISSLQLPKGGEQYIRDILK